MHKAKGRHTSGMQKVGDIPGSMDREEARIICSQMNGIREMIDEEHKVRTCDVCKTQGKAEVEITPSHDNADLYKECRQSATGQEKANCCNECGAYEKEIQGQKCKYCWASSLKK